MTTDNIFSGLKVVDFASFIAGPSAAVILSDFGAEVVKVEAPTGDTSPCLSRTGSLLYFSSDRPGGKGGRDLWVIETRWFKK